MGFRSGDHIISYDDYEPEDFMMLQVDLARHTPAKAVVERGGDTLEIYIDHGRIGVQNHSQKIQHTMTDISDQQDKTVISLNLLLKLSQQTILQLILQLVE
jgi:hypothetical protein